MSKTQDLKKIITTELNKVLGQTYYKVAPDNAVFPYKVYFFDRIDLGNFYRYDLILTVNVWDKSTVTSRVDEICDEIEKLFDNRNIPTATVLPTFFKISRSAIDDEDKSLQRVLLKFQIQSYTISF